MIRSCPSYLLAAAVFTACASTGGRSDPDEAGPGSSVEYVIPKAGRANRTARAPAAPPARAGAQRETPSRAPANVVRAGQGTGVTREAGGVREVVRHSSGSVIRYEPIEDDLSDLVGHDDHAEATRGGTAREDELPLEDRAGHPVRVRPEVGAGRALGKETYAPRFTADGVAFPYPVDHVFRGFGPCVGRRHVHEAIDIGGVGPQWGIGTPIRAMTQSEIVFIGRGDENPDDFGVPDKRPGEAARGDKMLPRMKEIAGYGKVYFFTRRQGRWRSGTIIVARTVGGGPLAGTTVRYLHLGAVHPSLAVGDVVEAGQEIGLMGGTGVQQSAPHLHLDIEGADGKRLDVTPILGLPPTASCGVEVEAGAKPDASAEGGASEVTTVPAAPAPAPIPRAPVAAARPAPTPTTAASVADVEKVWTQTIEVPPCGTWSREESFASGKYDAHALAFDVKAGQTLTLALERRHGAWAPALQAEVPRGGKFVAAKAGPQGQKATLAAKTAGRVVVRIGAAGPDAPPSAASYGFTLVDQCVAAKATPKPTPKTVKPVPTPKSQPKRRGPSHP